MKNWLNFLKEKKISSKKKKKKISRRTLSDKKSTRGVTKDRNNLLKCLLEITKKLS